MSVLQWSALFQACWLSLSLAVFFLLAYLEENKIWPLYPLFHLMLGSDWWGWRMLVARVLSPVSRQGCVLCSGMLWTMFPFLPQGSALVCSRGFFHREQSPSYFFFFFFFPLEFALGKELGTICTRKHMLMNDCVSPSPLGTSISAAEGRQQCVRRPANCQWRQNE